MTVYAPLFSHDATPFTPGRLFTTTPAADEYGRAVCDAQPGIEFELMRHLPNTDDWTSVFSGETPAEVQRRRWQGPVIRPRRAGKATARAAYLKHTQERIRP